MEEAQYYDLQPLVKDIERLRARRSNGVDSSSGVVRPAVKTEPGTEPRESIDCVWVHISPDLGERISLSADRHMLEEVFPELNSALLDTRNSGWNMDSRYVLRFPLNGFCKLNSLQVMQRLLSHGYQCVACTGGGVEGQQFSDYLLTKKASFWNVITLHLEKYISLYKLSSLCMASLNSILKLMQSLLLAMESVLQLCGRKRENRLKVLWHLLTKKTSF